MWRGSAESTSLSAEMILDMQQHGIHLHIQLYIQLDDDGLATYDSMRIPDAITFFLSTLHGNFGHCAQVLWMKYTLGIPLRKAWATVGLADFLNKAAVHVNDKFLAHVCTGVTWENLSLAVNRACISADDVNRFIYNCERLWIDVGSVIQLLIYGSECFDIN